MAQLSIYLDVAEKRYPLLKLFGREAVATPFHFQATLQSSDVTLSCRDPASLIFVEGKTVRTIIGVITQVHRSYGEPIIRITLESKLVLLKQDYFPEVFLDETLFAIIKKRLLVAGYEEWQLEGQIEKNRVDDFNVQLPHESSFDFIHRLLRQAGLFYWEDADGIHVGDSLCFPELDFDLLYVPQTGLTKASADVIVMNDLEVNAKREGYSLHVTSQSPALMPAYQVSVNTSALSDVYSRHYKISSIKHSAVSLEGSQYLFYKNEFTLDFNNEMSKVSKPDDLSHAFLAKIESPGDYPYLDDAGRYRCRLSFDGSGYPIAAASMPLRRIMPFGGLTSSQPVGIHFPLKHNTEVLVSFIENDPDQLVILGAIPNEDNPSPINESNADQHRWVTEAGHELLWDEGNDKQFTLATKNNSAALLMSHEQLALHADHMTHDINQSIEIISDNDLVEQVKQKKESVIRGDYTVSAQGEISYSSSDKQIGSSKENLRINAEGGLSVLADGGLEITTDSSINIKSEAGSIDWHIMQGRCAIFSENDLVVTGDGQGTMKVSQGQAGFQIDPDGTVMLWGKHIHLDAEDHIEWQGELNYQ